MDFDFFHLLFPLIVALFYFTVLALFWELVFARLHDLVYGVLFALLGIWPKDEIGYCVFDDQFALSVEEEGKRA